MPVDLVCSILPVTSTHHVSFVDIYCGTQYRNSVTLQVSLHCNSAVASIPVEPSTSSEHDPEGGFLHFLGIDHNEFPFELPLQELQMQEEEGSIVT